MIKIQKGYKLTEAGVIPEDWEVMLIDAISDVKSGKRLPLGKSLTDEETTHPYIRVTDMFQGGVSIEAIKFVPENVYPSIKNYRIYKDDIFISVAGTLGIVGKIPNELDGANLTENADRLTNISCDRDFLLYFLSSSFIQNTIDSERTLGAQPKLALIRIRNFQIPLPPTKSEQTAIATALSDADALIASLEKLIEKKRAIKQGAMQELLRPKEGWVEKPITEIISLMTNGFVGIVKLHYSESDSGILYIQGYNVEENSFNFNGIKRVTHEFHNQHLKSCLQEGDLLTIQTGDIGITTVVPKELDGANCHALIITRFKKNKVDSRFYSYYFNSFEGKSRLKEIETGSTMKHLNVGDMIQMWMPYPSKSEQTRIATLLSDMDAEITVLKQKLGKYKLVKQGMMQELLTGRIRLVE